MGFGEKWCKWIDSCLKSAKTSILVNGSPTKEFFMERGVRQGDPLSPFLFLIVAEGLNVVMKKAVEEGYFKGLKIGNDEVCLSHLQYVDDTLIFGEWSDRNAKNLIRIMKCFQHASGLKINNCKSKVYGVGANDSEVESLADRMGCLPGKFPCSYLGLPIGVNMRRVDYWRLLKSLKISCRIGK